MTHPMSVPLSVIPYPITHLLWVTSWLFWVGGGESLFQANTKYHCSVGCVMSSLWEELRAKFAIYLTQVFFSESMHDVDEILSGVPGQVQWFILGVLKFKLKITERETIVFVLRFTTGFVIVVWKAISISQSQGRDSQNIGTRLVTGIVQEPLQHFLAVFSKTPLQHQCSVKHPFKVSLYIP